jgi:hypothetical protein
VVAYAGMAQCQLYNPCGTFSTDHLPAQRKCAEVRRYHYVKNTSKKYILRTCSSLVIPSAQTTFTFLPAQEGAKMVRAEAITSRGNTVLIC